jgi:hypothetical protein
MHLSVVFAIVLQADLKEGLGIGCFEGEYHASDMSEVHSLYQTHSLL